VRIAAVTLELLATDGKPVTRFRSEC